MVQEVNVRQESQGLLGWRDFLSFFLFCFVCLVLIFLLYILALCLCHHYRHSAVVLFFSSQAINNGVLETKPSYSQFGLDIPSAIFSKLFLLLYIHIKRVKGLSNQMKSTIWQTYGYFGKH